MINISDIIDKSIINDLKEISDSVKAGDTVIGIWFSGDYEIFLLKLEEIDMGDDKPTLGSCDYNANLCYCIDYAWGIFSVDDYKKHDPNFELKIKANKYNL